ncbi:MAG: acetyl-CoA carboxylase carboxyltransferase subunit alpha [Candidatus Omnitrophica bacterium]|nr:acetyl-CoA carboxylase carboxyltransferase subunit alpha [Candidatus Omnitrophota bacterium]MBU4488131.1 acetyl-CoA carboxylase carboxyltransferase subunit alpha [Candidatus Omnitrophota bacterium]MCG2704965.1 acetyl-CoA carboxylase carboxyltransferase subunit alpha [Candidatus Omnitrophota bacterium]
MNRTGLDFEKPVVELERKIEELKKFSSGENMDLSDEIKKLEEKLEKAKKEIFENLTPWQRVQIARHPKRPYTLDYISMIMTDFMELHGDRAFSDDKSIITGFAKIDGDKICVVGHQKGKDTKENLERNFGSAQPEGYRKAIRVMKLAEKFKIPIVSFIDTPGAYPGIGAEERGQAGAIAYNLMEMAVLQVPIIIIVIGEGGSGGALGIGVGDKICVLENAYYSVISPEGCAAILWKDRAKASIAAEVLKLTAQDLYGMGLIDDIIKEPLGGAHRVPAVAASNIKKKIIKYLGDLGKLSTKELLETRYAKFRKIGIFEEADDSDETSGKDR